MVQIFDKGKCVYEPRDIKEIREYCKDTTYRLWGEVTRFENPHPYYVDLSKKLWDVKYKLLEEKSM